MERDRFGRLDYDRDKYMTVREYATKYYYHWNTITYRCRKGLIKGAIKTGNGWLIPREAEG